MMKYVTVTLTVLILYVNALSAQEDSTQHKRKIFNHSVGVQMNELVRQVFNFNNNATSINNPYLLMYSLNFAKSGWGVRAGIGPWFNTFKDDDGVTIQENNVNVLNARFGIEKAFMLSYRWSAGIGIDGIYGSDISYSKTFTRSFDSTSTDISSNTSFFGGGTTGWIRYNISPKIQIGTEASFYYKTGDYKQTITIKRKVNNSNGPYFETTIAEVDNKLKEGRFNLPMVFYLIVKF